MKMVGKRGLLMAGLAGALVLVVGTATSASASTTYQVAPNVRLNVRSGPGTSYPVVRVLPYDAKVIIYCQSPGTTVNGYYGTSSIWDNISSDQFISDAYVDTGSDGYITGRCA
ncbi:SH3 domain-containing protein [Streptomyces sp. NPDC059373]